MEPSMDQRKSKLIRKFTISLSLELAILMFILMFMSIQRVRTALTDTMLEADTNLVSSQATTLVQRNSKFMQQLRMYTNSDFSKQKGSMATIDEIQQYLIAHAGVRSSDFEDIYYCDVATGMAVSDTGKEINLKGTAVYEAIVKGNLKQYVSDPVGSNAEDSVYYVCKCMQKNSQTYGFYMATVSHSTLVKAVNVITVGESGFAVLLTSNGTVMAFPPDDNKVLRENAKNAESKFNIAGLTSIVNSMLAGETSNGWITYAGKQYAMIYTPVSGTPWSLALVSPKNEILKVAFYLQNTMTGIGLIVFLIIMITVCVSLALTIKPLRVLDENITQIASGDADLTKRIPVHTHDEIASVTRSFNLFMEKLREIMSHVKGSKENLKQAGESLQDGIENNNLSVEEILNSLITVNSHIENQRGSVQDTSQAVNQIAQDINSLEDMISNQTAGITEASAAVEQMIGNIASVNYSVESMAIAFDDLESKARKGNLKQTEMAEKIKLIEGQSIMLQEANAAIASIAEQTNLLAMNAAIEAAHAGESGKGFAVVAGEIRKLSETASFQSKTIGEQLQSINNSIDGVVVSSADTKATFDAVSAGIRETDNIVHRIKNAMAEQNQGSQQIVNALKDMGSSASQVSEASRDMTEGNKAILTGVQRLEQMTQEIQSSMEVVRISARKIRLTGTSLTEISTNMNNAIDTIGSQIDNFRI